mmetsp:Transcript_62203/g.110899  ORF Transcript_62203/g.110899 Transcript_62203/m.110899 type:complete len:213 (-) Transcript_62203:399-1037(-)
MLRQHNDVPHRGEPRLPLQDLRQVGAVQLPVGQPLGHSKERLGLLGGVARCPEPARGRQPGLAVPQLEPLGGLQHVRQPPQVLELRLPGHLLRQVPAVALPARLLCKGLCDGAAGRCLGFLCSACRGGLRLGPLEPVVGRRCAERHEAVLALEPVRVAFTEVDELAGLGEGLIPVQVTHQPGAMHPRVPGGQGALAWLGGVVAGHQLVGNGD